MGEALVGGTK